MDLGVFVKSVPGISAWKVRKGMVVREYLRDDICML